MTGASARPGVGEVPFGPPRLGAAPLDDADPLQFLEPRRQQRLRHQRNAAPYVAEMRAAGEQFGDDERRPSLRHDLRRFGNGTELAVMHGKRILRIAGPRCSRFWTNGGRAAP